MSAAMSRGSIEGCSSLVELSRRRAELEPDAPRYTFLVDGDSEEARLGYGALDRRARAIGALLQDAGARGERVLLLYPPGLEYVAAFMGCLYAGAVAVPAYPPDPSRLARTLPRLRALVADAGAALALTTPAIRSVAGALSQQAPELAEVRWLSDADAADEDASAWRDPGATRDTVALLQYTSGSTSSPRGVVLTHANLLHNSAAIHHCFAHGAESRGVIWLPPYHDMGLIGGVLQPLCGGFPVVLLSPIDFLKRPLRWLQAISRHRATTSGGPNFAYDLCVRKISADERAALDLSSWSLAFNGAEPVQAETLERFARAFAPHGFRREAFYPCYGLAEATLIVAGGRKADPPVVQSFDAIEVERGQITGAPEGRARRLVGCGASLPDQEIVVVDPVAKAPLPEGRVGEIWVRGPSVAQGYWSRPEETAETFRAIPSGASGEAYLRTGDLGFFLGGELFVTGRIKDLLILRGRNLYPQDVELTATSCHPALRPGCAAAFTVEVGGEERAVLVHELDPRQPFVADALIDTIRRAVAGEHELHLATVALLAPGSLPKTSSGKVQRRACRAMFLDSELTSIAASTLAAPDEEPSAEPRLTRGALLAIPPAGRSTLVEEHLRARAARVLRVPAAALDAARSLAALGLDSIQSLELASAIEDDLGVSLPASLLLDDVGLPELAARLLDALEAPAAAPPLIPRPRGAASALSFAQERLLFLDQLAPGNPAYHVPAAVELVGHLDVTALGRSLSAIARRHEALRTTFTFIEGRPQALITPPDSAEGSDCFAADGAIVEAPDLSEGELRRRLAEEAQRPFDLRRGPLWRARLLRLASDRHVLLLVVHHLVCDGWSMGVLVRELGAHYAAHAKGGAPDVPELPIQYGDHAAWQRGRLAEGMLDTSIAYWKEALAGAPPLLDLPTDRPRPAQQSFAGAVHPIALPAGLTAELKELGRAEGATLFMALLAGLLVVLHDRTGRTDLVVGADVANRDRPETRALVGLFVNQLVLRVDLAGDPTFREILERARRTALGAYAWKELPFDKLVEALRPPRDPRHNPFFQVMLVLENAPMPPLSLAGLELTLREVEDGGAPFDLSLLLSESPEGLRGVLRYSKALFDAGTAARLAEDLQAILAAAIARPDARLTELRASLAALAEQRRAAEQEALRSARLDKFRTVRRRSGR